MGDCRGGCSGHSVDTYLISKWNSNLFIEQPGKCFLCDAETVVTRIPNSPGNYWCNKCKEKYRNGTIDT